MTVEPPTPLAGARPQPLPGRRWLPIATLAIAGAIAYLTKTIAEVDLRYLMAAILGIAFAALCMIFIRRLPEVLLYFMILSIPLFTFEKTFMWADQWVDFGTPGFNLGALDIFLVLLYGLWWIEIFITHKRQIPKLMAADWVILAYLLANALSLVNSASRNWTTFELYRVLKYAAAYFYIAHRLERKHLRGILLALLLGLALESTLAVYQFKTGSLLGIARSKGAVTSELNTQYEVPEFEGNHRAEGTTIDSHALGIYIVVLLMFPFCLSLAPWLSRRDRILSSGAFLVGLPGLVASFSRGAWAAFAIAVALVLLTYVLWGRTRVIRVFAVLSLLMLPPVLIGGGTLLGKRIFSAPSDIMTARWDTVLSGYEIWRESPITGRGVNAYFHAQRDVGRVYDLTNNKPAHNIAVYVLAQAGVVGLLCYIVMLVYTVRQGLILARMRDPFISLLGLAIAAGMLAVQADGIVDFMSFTNQVYFMQFLCLGLVAGMTPIALRAADFPQAALPDSQSLLL